jgi:hypothetical protein
METFNFKKLSHMEVNNIKLKTQAGMELWKTWMIMWTSTGFKSY